MGATLVPGKKIRLSKKKKERERLEDEYDMWDPLNDRWGPLDTVANGVKRVIYFIPLDSQPNKKLR